MLTFTICTFGERITYKMCIIRVCNAVEKHKLSLKTFTKATIM